MNRQHQRHDWLLTLWWVKYWCFQVQVQIKIFTNANSKGKYEQTTPKAWLAADPLVSQDSYRSQGRESWGVETLCCFVWLSFTTTLAPTQFRKNNRFPYFASFSIITSSCSIEDMLSMRRHFRAYKISNVVCSQLAMMLQVFDRPESHSELPVDSNEPMIVQTVHKWTFLCVRCRVLLWTLLPFNSGPGRGFRHKQGP